MFHAKKLNRGALVGDNRGEQHVAQCICRLVVHDKSSKKNFLIDSGADISVLPPTYNDRFSSSKSTLFAANGSEIKTFGNRRLTIDLGLRRAYTWTFVVADVSSPGLLID